MKATEIEALLRAHHGRASSVARYHVLRQATLEPADASFLQTHAHGLDLHSLQRWLTLLQNTKANAQQRKYVIQAFAARATSDASELTAHLVQSRSGFAAAAWDELRAELERAGHGEIAARMKQQPSSVQTHTFTDSMSLTGSLLDDLDLGDGFDLPDPSGSLEQSSSTQASLHEMLAWPRTRAHEIVLHASESQDPQSLVSLLTWLENHGGNLATRAALIERFLTRVAPSRALIDHLASVSRPNDIGRELARVMVALLTRGHTTEVSDWCTQASSQSHPQSDRMHLALAEALSMAFAEIARTSKTQCLPALAALDCLMPLHQALRPLHALSTTLTSDSSEGVLCARVSSHVMPRALSLEDLTCALYAFADACNADTFPTQ